MPPRLGYKKSRGGCLRCKTRRVKCDENHPQCGWCRAHQLRCKYPTEENNTTSSTSSTRPLPSVDTSDNHSSAGESTSANSQPALSRRALEIGLFHYYVINIAPLYPFVDRNYGLDLHANRIPQLALLNPILLNAIYSYALLHLHIQNSRSDLLPRNVRFFDKLGLRVNPADHAQTNGLHESDSLMDPFTLHREYLDNAVGEQRKAVANITDQNADAVCLSSILIGMIALVHASEEKLIDRNSPYSIPLQWFYLMRSFSACLEIAKPLLDEESATMFMIRASPQGVAETLLSPSSNEFRHLLEWQPPSAAEIMDAAIHDIYEKALRCIENMYSYITDGKPWEGLGRHLLAFANVIPQPFVTLLEEKRPRALVMLAHFLAMAKRLDKLWWIFRGVADTHVRGLSTLVPQEWQWMLEWPLRILSEGFPSS